MSDVMTNNPTPAADTLPPTDKGPRRRSWLSFIGVAAAVMLILAAAGALAARPGAQPAAVADLSAVVAPGSASPSVGVKLPPSPQAVQPRIAQASLLLEVASRLRAHPEAEAQGRYTHVAVEQWFSQPDGIVAHREQRWFDTQTRRSYESRLALPAVSSSVFREAMIGHADFTSAEYTDSQYLVPLRSMPSPLSSDPVELRRILQADSTGHPLTGASIVSAIGGFSAYTHPPLGVRAAALELLATMDGLTITEAATDHLGRTGIQVVAVGTDQTLTVLIDPATGLAIAHHDVLRGGPGPISSQSWGLILTNTRTDTPELPAS